MFTVVYDANFIITMYRSTETQSLVKSFPTEYTPYEREISSSLKQTRKEKTKISKPIPEEV